MHTRSDLIQMAHLHWQQFRPAMVEELEAEGNLIDCLAAAADSTLQQMELLLASGHPEHIAWEMVREQHILMPEEAPVIQDDPEGDRQWEIFCTEHSEKSRFLQTPMTD